MIEIQKLSEEDVAEVSRLEAETFSMPWHEADFLEMITCEYAYYLVAKEDGNVIGTCGIRNMCGDGEITNVAIKHTHRRRGIGEQMLTALLEQSREIGVRNYTLEVRESNTAAIGLYEKLGFVSAGHRPGFYDKPKEDAVIMWKRTQDC